ncbi:MAG: 30S ribosomal protein S6 [Candidatus Paceibacterota bacterium]|jgi:ribosomal protein S6
MEQEINTETKVRYEIAFVTETEDTMPIKAVLSKHNSKVLNEKPTMKIQLAYKIDKIAFGFMGSIEFLGEPETVKEIKSELWHSKDVIRFMISKKPEVKQEEGRGADREPRTGPSAPTRLKNMIGSMLSNEALEKKIEEILQ